MPTWLGAREAGSCTGGRTQPLTADTAPSPAEPTGTNKENHAIGHCIVELDDGCLHVVRWGERTARCGRSLGVKPVRPFAMSRKRAIAASTCGECRTIR
jgi:hypothetical protein